jgi:chemotaxis protein methyltransferase CheR
LASANRQPLIDIDDVHTLAQGIVDTIRDPLLVLDQHLRVVSANRAFCQTFRMTRQNIEDCAVYALGDGQWNSPALRFLLDNIAPHHTVMEGYEVEREFPGIGRRSMLLNAREVVSQRNARKLILLTIEDVTERRAAERETAELLRQKEMLLQEVQHRIANSLQIIASILLLKVRAVLSEETRMYLRDAHQRIMSVAAVQQQLLTSNHGDPVYVGPYLSRLCQALAASMTDDSHPISLEVQAEGGGTASSAEAASMGLIVAELVINAFKHAFVGDEASGLVVVAYEAAETSWQLTVSDNGIGTHEGQLDSDKPRPGLGTIIVAGLAKQLEARVEVMRGRSGTTVSITHGTSDRAWLPPVGAGIGSPPKSNGNSVAGADCSSALLSSLVSAAACHDLLSLKQMP